MFYDVLWVVVWCFIEKSNGPKIWLICSKLSRVVLFFSSSRWYNTWGQNWRIWRPDLGFWMFGMQSSFTVCFGAWRQTCLASIDNTYFIVTYLAILQSVMRTLLSFRFTDPTKVADIDRWKGMCDPTTPVEITTEPSLVAVYRSILFELSAALACIVSTRNWSRFSTPIRFGNQFQSVALCEGRPKTVELSML